MFTSSQLRLNADKSPFSVSGSLYEVRVSVLSQIKIGFLPARHPPPLEQEGSALGFPPLPGRPALPSRTLKTVES